jgi:UDP-glucose 4-epimerase
MKVLVTGACGNLGRAVIPVLIERGHEVVALDFRRYGGPGEALEVDVRDSDEVADAAEGVDAIVHGAALHGVHLGRWSEDDFWSINVTGTFNMFEAARRHNITRFVLSSTMGVYGKSLEPSPEAWAIVTEESPLLPMDVYGMSKVLCEEMATYYARAHGVVTVALRFGMYVPETFERYGFRLLFGGVDDRDVAQAVVLALDHQPPGGFDVFDIMADTPFRPADARELRVAPGRVLERYWPGTLALLEERGLVLDDLMWAYFMWPIAKAKEILGYRPQFNFGEFLAALRNNDHRHYPVAGLPQWGVEERATAHERDQRG